MRAAISPARTSAATMYSSPVAESSERMRAVRQVMNVRDQRHQQAEHDRARRRTAHRRQTARSTLELSAPGAEQKHRQQDRLDDDRAEAQERHPNQRPDRQSRRHQVPVAERQTGQRRAERQRAGQHGQRRAEAAELRAGRPPPTRPTDPPGRAAARAAPQECRLDAGTIRYMANSADKDEAQGALGAKPRRCWSDSGRLGRKARAQPDRQGAARSAGRRR